MKKTTTTSRTIRRNVRRVKLHVIVVNSSTIVSCMRSTVRYWRSALCNLFSQRFPFSLSLILLTYPSWAVCCFAASLLRRHCRVMNWSRHGPVTVGILCCRGAWIGYISAAFTFPSLVQPNLEPSKLEGCWFAHWRCVRARS